MEPIYPYLYCAMWYKWKIPVFHCHIYATKVLRLCIVFVFLQYNCIALVFAFRQLKTTMAVGLRIPIRLVSTMDRPRPTPRRKEERLWLKSLFLAPTDDTLF